MIDNLRTGRNIVHYRRLSGWTQGELARRLNVTHQAVSKWENGVALPDISTLLTLSHLFGISIEQLLTGEPEGCYENDILMTDELAEEDFSEEIPDEEAASEESSDPDFSFAGSEQGSYDWDTISRLAPFASSNTLDELVRRCETSCDMKHLHRLAPFLSTATFDRLIRSCSIDSADWDTISHLAPFTSQATLDELVRRCEGSCNMKHLHRLAPFLSTATLDRLILASVDSADWTTISRLAPFASSNTLDELVRRCETSCDMKHIHRLAPFLGKATLDRLIRKAMSMPAKEPDAAPEPAQAFESFVPFLKQHIKEETLSHLISGVASRKDRRRTEIRTSSPELAAYAEEIVQKLYAACDAADPITGRFEEIRQALESQDYRTLNEFGSLLDQHIGPEWLEKYAELCIPEETPSNFTEQVLHAVDNRDWGWIEDHAHFISDQQLVQHIVQTAASEGFFDFIPLFINDLDQSLIDYAAQQAVAHHATDDILPFKNRVSPGILD